MANYTQYIPQINSTTYPTSINNCFTALTSDVSALETDKLNLSGGAMVGIITNFESTGIDDNASSTAIVINATGTTTFNGNVNISGTTTLSSSIDVRNDGLDQTLAIWRSDLGVSNRDMSLKSPTTDSATEPFRWITDNSFAWEIDGTEAFLINSAGETTVRGALTIFGNTTINATLEVGGYIAAVNSSALTNGRLVSADAGGRLTTSADIQTANIILDYTPETITGVYTFNSIPVFNGGTSGSLSPFTVDSTQVVTNLNADTVDGTHLNRLSVGNETITTGNADDYKDSGGYRMDPIVTNLPTSHHYAVQVFGNDTNVTTQIATKIASTDAYIRTFNTTWTSWNKLWNAGNDGPASGLNADLLDGQHGSYYYSSANIQPGSVLQTVQSIRTTVYSSNATSYVDTGITVTITPASTSSKILLQLSGVAGPNVRTMYFAFYRNTTSLIPGGTDAHMTAASNLNNCLPLNMLYLDSPNTTSAITYRLYYKGQDTTTNYIGRRADNVPAFVVPTIFTAQELSG